ncbi:MAG: ATP-binding cassette domain-containing protein [Rhodospirillaceae bacterium]|jgi:tungstate transport system ATP-binding protein|nr:ATP-binding cassette domain-containing protein [Rhodospirillaceae bacterium]MBT6205250.1 ATP-binding cassette domain-containing protein [Rhodospirillaceae bacterium]MBT6509164.1 ATP-binding cassette domain-containing protein [Rhodospirillaceae bacterium]MBT7611867.1 ATP-binding cassette domain-containing protein [Rhodospirillaceae bacterium]MBT7646317.1 ATP-binding cassette domain-containing protein [Rhodospirillaceae bacterium]
MASAAPRSSLALPIRGEALALRRGGRLLVDDLNLSLEKPGITTLMGPNGAGKSLTVRMLAGLVEPDSGQVTWAGRAPDRARASSVGLVFHRPVMLRRSALDNVRYGLKAAGVPRGERRERAMAALARGRLEHVAASPAWVLSGGEQQRLALVRALAVEPEALLLDEPTANLDPASTLAIEELVSQAQARGTAVLLVTHDLGQARRLADRVVFLNAGGLSEDTPAVTFFDQPRTPQAQAFVEGRLVL